jgi:hypothetical protein
MAHEPAKQISSDIGSLLSRLAEFGYEPVGSQYSAESFGNYFIDFKSRTGSFRVVRDRSQYYVDTGSDEELRQAGMLQAFDDRGAFEAALLNWLAGQRSFEPRLSG